MDPAMLADMIRVELRPLPGVGDAGLRVLGPADLTVKPLNELASGGDFTYMIRLREPIGYGTHATLIFRLSSDERIPGNAASYVYTTAEVFLLTAVGSGNSLLPVTQTGASYASSQAISLGSSARPVGPQVLGGARTGLARGGQEDGPLRAGVS
jgi:hypothetical protein